MERNEWAGIAPFARAFVSPISIRRGESCTIVPDKYIFVLILVSLQYTFRGENGQNDENDDEDNHGDIGDASGSNKTIKPERK